MATPGDADLATVGALLSDPARCRILLALGDGRALTASRLAGEAGVAASTASGHLAKLERGGLLTVHPHGRHRYFRLAGPEVAEMIEAVMRISPARPVRSLRQGTRAAQLREARTCYDHLAGRLGVALMARLIERGLVAGGDGAHDHAGGDGPVGYGRDVDYALTPDGHAFLDDLGVDGGRRGVRYCVDWTEQRHHLAGGAGRALLARLRELDWLRPAGAHRAVVVTPAGVTGLEATFAIAWPPA